MDIMLDYLIGWLFSQYLLNSQSYNLDSQSLFKVDKKK